MSDAPLVALIASGSLLFAVHRVASAWEQVSEGKVRRGESVLPASGIPAPVDIPEDLLALAMQENEVWAQEELLRVMRERYETYRDWNRVRSAMGLGIRT